MQKKNTWSPPTKRSKQDRSTNFQIKAILPSDYTEISLETVYTCKVTKKQQISSLIKELSQHLPLITLQHLKRVRENEIIVCRKKDIGNGVTLKEFLNKTLLTEEIKEILNDNISEVEVPAFVCKLRCQYDRMRMYWPCKFHPDKYLESLYDGTCFTSTEIDFHNRIANLLLQISEDLESQRPCCLCVDPRSNSVVCISASRTEINPLYHCTMVMIDYVARTQKPCVLSDKLTEEFVEASSGKTAERTMAGMLQKYWDYLQRNGSYKSIEFGAEHVKLNEEKLQENPIFEAGDDNLSKYGPYLCTGYDIYLTDEPCLMCSMALVHSRARRIFFIRQSTENGALLTKFNLQEVKELNHHYEVFQYIAS